MKKLMTMIITTAMILTMAVPAFADDADGAVVTVKPTKVQELKVLKNGYKSLKVTWKAVDGAEKYQVYRSKTGKSGSFALKKTTTGTTYTNTGITCGKTYYYKVRAVNSKGKGAFSTVRSSKVQPGKAVITKVNCISEFKVRIYWNKVAGATGYQVYRSKKGANSWKLYKTVASKYNYATNYLEGDTKYSKWEWKVRAYRIVNGKKVYGYFSTPKEWIPDWTIDEIYEELWKYGESLAWTKFEYIEGKPNPNDWNENSIWPTNETYHFKHCIGSYTFDGGENWNGIYTNPANGNTSIPTGAVFEADTPENSSWSVTWPDRISYYDTKASLLKRLKPLVKNELSELHKVDPLYWDPLWEVYSGVEDFTIYIRNNKNSYRLWLLY